MESKIEPPPVTPNVNEEFKFLTQPEDMNKFILSRYKRQIDYYWKTGATNKKTYKFNRTMVIILGASVTLISSLSAAAFIKNVQPWDTIFSLVTPALAAILTILNGLIQSFQSGAAWRDMVLNAERLEKERDRFIATPERERDYKGELEILDSLVLSESTAFFKRILDSEPETEDFEKKSEQAPATP
jgi:hypothetical protein